MLTIEEENDLAVKMAEGDADAREKLIVENLSLVKKIANDYKGMGVDVDDLIGAGNVGLVQGAGRFRAGKGAKFSTFVANHIKHEMKKLLSAMSGPVSMTIGVYGRKKKIHDIRKKLGDDASIDDVAEKYGSSRTGYVRSMLANNGSVSLDEKTDGDDGRTYGEVIGSECDEGIVEGFIHKEMLSALSGVIDSLTDIEKRVICQRYGIGCEARTLMKIGHDEGITAERVRQIEAQALVKMKGMLV